MRNHPAYLAGLALFLMLMACSSGGGSGSASPTVTTPAVAAVPAPALVTTVGQPQDASLRGNTLPLASGGTPNFTNSLPPNGTVFSLNDSVIQISFSPSSIAVTGYTNSLSSGTMLTFTGTQIINGNTVDIFQFKEPGLSIDTSASGSTLPDGRRLFSNVTALNYTLLDQWMVFPPTGNTSGTSYWGEGISGYQTPVSGVPTSGTAAYAAGGPGSGTGQVIGMAFIPTSTALSDSALQMGLSGRANINVNFSSATLTGSLNNMTAMVEGDTPWLPWNDVALTGTLSGATVKGTTAVTTVPSNSLAIDGGSKGTFTGAMFGPHGEEIGINWNLYSSTGSGQAAFGTVGATKQ
jgi:hypothetical protein